jgi:hypothetical protein
MGNSALDGVGDGLVIGLFDCYGGLLKNSLCVILLKLRSFYIGTGN